MIVDAHLHVWRRSRGDYGWLTPASGVLWRDYEAEDARAELASAGVAYAILVQAAPTVAESALLLDLAKAHDWVLGVVGWVDLTGAAVGEELARLREAGPLVGVRAMLQDIDDPDWMLRADVASGLEAVAAAGVVFDALVRPVHLQALATLADRHPDLQIIVNHAGKPPIGNRPNEGWCRDIARLAEQQTIACKFSGLVSEAGPGWTEAMLEPIVETLLEKFGPSRILWGSDWPVCTPTTTYRGWLDTAEALLATRVDADDRARIVGGNATTLYRLKGTPA